MNGGYRQLVFSLVSLTYFVGEAKVKHNQITLLDVIPQFKKHMGGTDFCKISSWGQNK